MRGGLRAIERAGLRLYRDFVVLNEADAALVKAAQPQAHCVVMSNGVTVPDDLPGPFGAAEHILFMGRIDVRQKGLDLLLEAYERSGLKLPLLVAGSGRRSQRRMLERLLAGCRAPVIWLGHLNGEAKQQALRDAAFAVLPSR
jgi:glycosyltransferase involved in cell wall biosynthesis